MTKSCFKVFKHDVSGVTWTMVPCFIEKIDKTKRNSFKKMFTFSFCSQDFINFKMFRFFLVVKTRTINSMFIPYSVEKVVQDIKKKHNDTGQLKEGHLVPILLGPMVCFCTPCTKKMKLLLVIIFLFSEFSVTRLNMYIKEND